jgi:hypothetical protein
MELLISATSNVLVRDAPDYDLAGYRTGYLKVIPGIPSGGRIPDIRWRPDTGYRVSCVGRMPDIRCRPDTGYRYPMVAGTGYPVGFTTEHLNV